MEFEHFCILLRLLFSRLTSERGQTMSEYGILIAWLALVVIVGATKVGSVVSQLFSSTAHKL